LSRPLSVTALPFTLCSILTLLLLAAPVAVGAQGRVPERSPTPTRDTAGVIPREMIPPAGKCRIWMDGVPAAQQPAPTDCTTALRKRPANSVLVFGPAKRDLSPFDVRNNTLPTRADFARRSAASRGDSSTRSETNGTTAAQVKREAEARQVPPNGRTPVARDAAPPPPRKPSTPPPKKPEKP
jgi:hypothetical protein